MASAVARLGWTIDQVVDHSLEQMEMILDELERQRRTDAQLAAHIARGAAHAEKDAWRDFLDSIAPDEPDPAPAMPRPEKLRH